MKHLIDKLNHTHSLSKEEWTSVIGQPSPLTVEYAKSLARELRKLHYGNTIYIRGLIEITNYCKNDCFYCGIRRSNTNINRYRLSIADILNCCADGYELGFRTFVLQGGEDGHFKLSDLVEIVSSIHNKYPDCAITLSLGERSYADYKELYDAGANRYLLRHETYDDKHYALLHPCELLAAARQECLWSLKEIGYQVGTGFMVGSPHQNVEHLAEDMLFLQKLNPHMVGIGPFITHNDTPFAKYPSGSLDFTLYMLSLIRILSPKVLLPATTALSSLDKEGQKKGIFAGANVIMPNLSPLNHRKDYALYNNKAFTNQDAAESLAKLKTNMENIGYQIVTTRGDSLISH